MEMAPEKRGGTEHSSEGGTPPSPVKGGLFQYDRRHEERWG